ncbi:hypothetical protein [Actinomadura verrucosospora]|uniref:Uncharacterized protein n=1 Tax=Actinomadura verrucosospora TaxID=46165 RepID=A0A7D3VYC1_ACTVE|nr:hypothetical protein [Actinomadura verrucosospora]QKG22016.1 hypothetical protein ACTIVE_3654 [Actinomadura verrucosospora]
MTRTDLPAGRGPATRSAVPARAYLIAGLAMGAAWAWNAGQPLWEHALKFGLLLFVGAPLLHLLQKRRAAARPAGGPRLKLVPVVAAKATVLAAALLASYLLRSTPHGDLYVAAGLAVAIAAFGPLLHRRFVIG